MSGRFKGWRSLPWRQRARVIEAALWLSAAWLTVRLLPFRMYARVLGRPSAQAGPKGPSSEAAARCARDVGLALRRASRHLPWRSTCLMQVLAGAVMLRSRGYRGEAFVGATSSDNAFEFHAWLLAAGIPVCGVHESARFTVLATFR